jgi:DDHD domain
MSPLAHTYGPTCRLAPAVTFSGSKSDDNIPLLKAQFFYASPLPIDDPLSAAPIPSSSDSKSIKHTPRPFSAYDNNALEESWLGLGSRKDKKNQRRRRSVSPTKEDRKRGGKRDDRAQGQEAEPKSPPEACACEGRHSLRGNGRDKCNRTSCPQKSVLAGASSNTQAPPIVMGTSNDSKVPNLLLEGQICSRAKEDGTSGASVAQKSDAVQDQDPSGSNRDHETLQRKHKSGLDEMEASQGDGADDDSIVTECSELRDVKEHTNSENYEDSEQEDVCPELQINVSRKSSGEPADEYADRQPVSSDRDGKKLSQKSGKVMVEAGPSVSKSKFSKKKDNSELSPQSSDILSGNAPVQSSDAGTTGSPFVKLPPCANSAQPSDQDVSGSKTDGEGQGNVDRTFRRFNERVSSETETVQSHGCKAHTNIKDQVDVPVGVSRLHLVQLPALQMKPIYWSPVHDICAVIRGTWFYKNTMYPVEPVVANQLESGYRELRPWSQTWNDELNSAIEVGAVGEEKIAHRLWPEDSKQKPSSHKGKEHHPLSNDPYCAAICFHGEAAAEGAIDPDDVDRKVSDPTVVVKRYSKSQVIYKDAHNAFILKPNLQPSAYYGRKPLQNIRRGNTVGIHVVRGFDWKAWEKLHPSRKTMGIKMAEDNAPISGDADARKRNTCAACRAQEERCNVTDLIFVIHGIGQKLSESMESFHFTHAINAFRRSVNVELGHEPVQRVLRKNLGGVMVLPINWRSRVSFDEGAPKHKDDKTGEGPDFSMKDITPTTIPAVRDFIEKVMLDIPYWMSIHKPKMIQAVISEANRVYRLWCKNNPEFHKEGRVHIIAHSLGSAMALDILSNQPTSLPKFDSNNKKMNTKCFDFRTTNLFFCGSPAGFFLYLEKGCLLPRRGQNKPGAGHSDEQDKAIVGDVGTFGCLAVDNIYNIMHPEDPIAYQVNATVDPQYAASLKRAQVPSATTGFFESIGNAVKSMAGASSSTDLSVGQAPKPAGLNRLPSQLEMEVHDFTREEIAEKKFGLLNDNGQIDYFLCSDSGPLSFQYINMLSAHSSYWESPDFVRMVVVEVGRSPGSNHCLPSMKAAKVGHKAQKGSLMIRG